MERNAPAIYLYGRNAGNGDRAAKVRIAYSREREDRRGRAEGEWTCKIVSYSPATTIMVADVSQCGFDNFATRQKCFRCQALRAGMWVAVASVGRS